MIEKTANYSERCRNWGRVTSPFLMAFQYHKRGIEAQHNETVFTILSYSIFKETDSVNNS